jgi:hypothetical protein
MSTPSEVLKIVQQELKLRRGGRINRWQDIAAFQSLIYSNVKEYNDRHQISHDFTSRVDELVTNIVNCYQSQFTQRDLDRAGLDSDDEREVKEGEGMSIEELRRITTEAFEGFEAEYVCLRALITEHPQLEDDFDKISLLLDHAKTQSLGDISAYEEQASSGPAAR